MSLVTGTLLQEGKYKIVRHLSSGGFGITYEAEHVMLRKRVAIKEFFVKDYCNRDDSTHHVTVGTLSKSRLVSRLRRKFIDEAIAISQLPHPHIVRVSDVFEENGTAYYVMDYIDGESLQQMVKKRGYLPEDEAVGYIRQVADALGYVHGKNRLHLDIKPGNIMVNSQGQAVLIDFGASKQYDEVDGENTSTLAGKTPGYAPVEQMGNRVQNFDPATDIYSLGATLYKLLCGVTPPDSTDIADDPSVLKPLPATVSAATRSAVSAAMHVRRKDRPASIEAFVALLDGAGLEDEATLVEEDEDTLIDIPEEKPEPKKPEPKKPEPAKPAGEGQKGGAGRKLLIAGIAVVVAIVAFVAMQRCGGSGAGGDEGLAGQAIDSLAEDSVAEDTLAVEHAENVTITGPDGETFTYTGDLAGGMPNGQGTGQYSYGEYTGPYVDGKMHGDDGTFKTADGDVYQGSFENGHYLKGRITMAADGSYFEGTFSTDGQPYNGTWYNSNGSVYTKVVNGN